MKVPLWTGPIRGDYAVPLWKSGTGKPLYYDDGTDQSNCCYLVVRSCSTGTPTQYRAKAADVTIGNIYTGPAGVGCYYFNPNDPPVYGCPNQELAVEPFAGDCYECVYGGDCCTFVTVTISGITGDAAPANGSYTWDPVAGIPYTEGDVATGRVSVSFELDGDFGCWYLAAGYQNDGADPPIFAGCDFRSAAFAMYDESTPCYDENFNYLECFETGSPYVGESPPSTCEGATATVVCGDADPRTYIVCADINPASLPETFTLTATFEIIKTITYVDPDPLDDGDPFDEANPPEPTTEVACTFPISVTLTAATPEGFEHARWVYDNVALPPSEGAEGTRFGEAILSDVPILAGSDYCHWRILLTAECATACRYFYVNASATIKTGNVPTPAGVYPAVAIATVGGTTYEYDPEDDENPCLPPLGEIWTFLGQIKNIEVS